MSSDLRAARPQAFSRREALNALAALSGAAAASTLLPDMWVKPVVGVGVVPAHAQSSLVCGPPYSIVGCAITDYSWRDHNNFDFTIRVNLNSPCAGIPMKWVMEILDVNNERIALFDYNLNINTNAMGSVVHRVGDYFYDYVHPYYFTVEWQFANLSEGAATCTSKLVFPLRP